MPNSKNVNYLSSIEKLKQWAEQGYIEVGGVQIPFDENDLQVIEIPASEVSTTTTMQTSTLPSISVPSITAVNITALYNAFSAGAPARIKATINSLVGTYGVISCDKDSSQVTNVRVIYHDHIVDYTADGSNVTATYIAIN